MKFILVILLCGLLGACSSTKLERMSDNKKAALAEDLNFSEAHNYWANQFGDGKAEIDYEELVKTKKIGIVGFDSSIFMSSADGLRGRLGENVYTSSVFSDKIFAKLKAVLEKKGFEVVSMEQMLANSEYQALKFENKVGEVKKVEDEYNVKAFPTNMKLIEFEKFLMASITVEQKSKIQKKLLERTSTFAALMHALGVDALLFVENRVKINEKRVLWGDADGINPVVVNLIAGTPPMIVWSATLRDGVKHPIDPDVKMDWGKDLVVKDAKAPSLEAAGPSLVLFYEDLAEIIGIKLSSDKMHKE